jgi:hypothetical protein
VPSYPSEENEHSFSKMFEILKRLLTLMEDLDLANGGMEQTGNGSGAPFKTIMALECGETVSFNGPGSDCC